MKIYGDIIYGEEFHIRLTKGAQNCQALLQTAKKRISLLNNYYGDIATIRLINYSAHYPVSPTQSAPITLFQAYKQKDYDKLDEYFAFLTFGEGQTKRVFKKECSLSDLLQTVDLVCGRDTLPDLKTWALCKAQEEETAKQEEKRNNHIISAWHNGLDCEHPSLFPEYFRALKNRYDNDFYDEWQALPFEYVARGKFSLFAKTYENDGKNSPGVLDTLGENYLYGRHGTPNFEKAYRCFSHAERLGNLKSRYHLALMHKNGLHVKRDILKYETLIRSIYDECLADWEDSTLLVFIHFAVLELARIEKEHGEKEAFFKIMTNYKPALEALSETEINESGTLWREFLELYYSVFPFKEELAELYDVIVLLQKPVCIRFRVHNRKTFTVETVDCDGELIVKFGNNYYRNAVEFFDRAKINGQSIHKMSEEITSLEVIHV
ncbi:MAG: sel1 repeat family protein [Clostridia bacterium]|nr:sel1 repeat family protein [Clostridia bacterium]